MNIKNKYDYLFITHLPCFYKINLYNELVKTGLKIKVIFIGKNSKERTDDFCLSENRIYFDYYFLSSFNFEYINKFKFFLLKYIYFLIREIKSTDYRLLAVNGWDLIYFWIAIFISKKSKNAVLVESTYLESNTLGLKKILKKLFLHKISYAFVSGDLHEQLMKKLNFKGNIIKTRGVGIINKPIFNITEKKHFSKKNSFSFLFIGRLVLCKNLIFLCEVFKELIDNNFPVILNIVGDGVEKNNLLVYESEKIKFHGYVNNTDLSSYYLSNDIFILSSLSETWGLVVEEALYYGLPVLISNKCGARELIKDNYNGFRFDPLLKKDFKDKIIQIINNYPLIKKNIDSNFIIEKDNMQINSYKMIIDDIKAK
jgi:glycosyltransferase involved in cell wall biosynthesis